jgi:hypothetical protein
MARAGRLPHMMEGQPAHRECARTETQTETALEVNARVLLVLTAIAFVAPLCSRW